MQLAFNFLVAYVSFYSYVVSRHEIETYLAQLERLKQFYFWMAYNADQWPIELVSPRGKLKPLG